MHSEENRVIHSVPYDSEIYQVVYAMVNHQVVSSVPKMLGKMLLTTTPISTDLGKTLGGRCFYHFNAFFLTKWLSFY